MDRAVIVGRTAPKLHIVQYTKHFMSMVSCHKVRTQLVPGERTPATAIPHKLDVIKIVSVCAQVSTTDARYFTNSSVFGLS